jgi:16S rRNA (cytidine1402-2'-O)-methyltransferase
MEPRIRRPVARGAERPDRPGQLYVVSTPIGNLGDLSYRAVEVLGGVDVILAEDTRHARVLLDHYEIRTPVSAYHDHNEVDATPALVARLTGGAHLALISDAGTPLLSDPGTRLVRAALEAGIVVTPVPGPSALLAALVASGIPAERFTFFGFPPRKGAGRQETLRAVAALEHAAVLYEAPVRVASLLRELAAAGCGDRPAAVARELTKQFEEVRRGTVDALAEYYADTPPRGEVVIIVDRAPPPAVSEATLRPLAAQLRAAGRSPRDVATTLRDAHGAPRNLAYRLAHEP